MTEVLARSRMLISEDGASPMVGEPVPKIARLVCIWDRKSVSQADLVLDATTNGCMQRLETERAFPACSGVRFVKEDGTEVFYGSTGG